MRKEQIQNYRIYSFIAFDLTLPQGAEILSIEGGPQPNLFVLEDKNNPKEIRHFECHRLYKDVAIIPDMERIFIGAFESDNLHFFLFETIN